MEDTRHLMLGKLNETKDRLEDITCRYRSRNGRHCQCAFQQLPAGLLGSFLAQSRRYTYFPGPSGRIYVLRKKDDDNYFSRFSGIVWT